MQMQDLKKTVAEFSGPLTPKALMLEFAWRADEAEESDNPDVARAYDHLIDWIKHQPVTHYWNSKIVHKMSGESAGDLQNVRFEFTCKGLRGPQRIFAYPDGMSAGKDWIANRREKTAYQSGY